ncbi:MAG: GNAT family N-acetyltransferase [Lachnospirales bacterium]
MIEFAKKNDFSQIRELWDIAFPEDKDFNDYFFDKVFDIKNVLVLKENNKILSMVQMIPFEIKDFGSVTYIYGAATFPYARGLGKMNKLLNKSFEYDKKFSRKASILIPAKKSLFDYYKKIGYKSCFYIDKKDFENTNIYKYKFSKANYNDIYNMLKIYDGDILRDYNYFKTQIDMFRSLGGEVFTLYDNENMLSYGFVWNNEKIEIQEFCGKYDEILVNHILNYYNKPIATVTYLKGNIPFGMAKFHCSKKTDKLSMNLMYN